MSNTQMNLNIGFIGKDFKNHSAQRSWGCLIKNYPGFKTYCYSDTTNHDKITEKLKQESSFWRDINGFNTDQVLNLIKKDKIDILVDLAGHTPGNRLDVFSKRAARVQVTGLGFGHTTGIKNMDYLIQDRYVMGQYEHAEIREKIVLMPSLIHWNTEDPSDIIDIEYPFEKNGFITFGVLNAVHKYFEQFVSYLALILKEIDRSKLFLKAQVFNELEMIDFMNTRLESRGIDKTRIIYGGQTSSYLHRMAYNNVDVVLDTFPYQGGVSTCEALFMGKPVIAVRTGTRATVSILSNTFKDTSQLIYKDHENAIKGIASNLDKIIDMRGIREMFLKSYVCKTELFRESFYDLMRGLAVV